MKTISIGVFLVTFVVSRSFCATDPCTTAISIGDPKRTTDEDPGTCSGLCDSYIVDGGWYRLDYSNSGTRMPESCVKPWHCGTYIPIWMNAVHPTADFAGPVTVPVCAQLTATGDCCEWKDQINVKRCFSGAEYFVYQLRKPPFCDMAYCSGSGPKCDNGGAYNDIIKNCTIPMFPPLDAIPTLTQPYISGSKTATDINGKTFLATKFSMKCLLSYTKLTTDDGARYLVVFEAEGYVLYTKILASTDEPFVEMSESSLAGHLDKNVICRVSAYWQSAYPPRSPYKISSPIYVGVEIKDASTGLRLGNTISLAEGDKLTVTVLPTFPVTALGCVDSSVNPCTPYYNFQVQTTGQIYLSGCTFQVSNNTVPNSFVLSPVVNDGFDFRTGSFSIVPANNIQTQTSIFSNYKSKNYQILITERNWQTCSSTGDPHVVSLYGNTFHTYKEGDYRLFSMPSRKIEIQARHRYFGSYLAWNCGVIAREGNNVIGINACPGETAVFTKYLEDKTNPGGYVINYGSTKKIVLPSGLQIDVVMDGLHIHLYVRTIWMDGQNNDGLCFNRDTPNGGDCGNVCDRYRVQNPSFFEAIPTCQSAFIVPQCDCSTGSNCVLPSGLALYQSGQTCNGPFVSRRKRQTTNTTTPPPDNNYVPPNPVWPTPKNNINETTATDACRNAMRQSKAYDTCIKDLSVDVTGTINSCVLDIQLLDDLSIPPKSMASQMELICKAFLDRSSDPSKDTFRNQVANSICPNQCSSRGTCNQGACTCNPGYVGGDCSVGTGEAPKVTKLLRDMCNVQNDPDGCTVAFVQASPLSLTLSCKITDTSGKVLYIDNSPQVNLGVVLCHLPSLRVSFTNSQNASKCNYYQVDISVSNDQTKYSSSKRFTVYDDKTSVNCDNNGSCELKDKTLKCSSDRNIAATALLFVAFLFSKLAQLR